MIKILLSIAFIVHGLAHIAGFLAPWTNARVYFKESSYFIGNEIKLKSLLGRLIGLLWLSTLFLYVLAGRALLSNYTSWLWLAQLGAIASFISVLSFWKAVPSGAKVGFVFDLIIVCTYIPFIQDFIFTIF